MSAASFLSPFSQPQPLTRVPFGDGFLTGDDLLAAGERGDVVRLAAIVDAGLDVDVRNKSLETALHVASRGGQTAACSVLLSKGANVDASDVHGRRPMHWAAQRGDVQIADLLIQNGADNLPAAPPDPAGFLYELGRCTLYLAPLEHGLSTSAATGKGALLPAFAPLGGTGASVAVEAHMVDEAVEVGVTRVEGVPREDGWGVVLEAHCDIPNSYATQEEGVLSLDESFPAYNGSASMNWTTRFLLSAHASLGGALADGTVTIDVFATPPPQPNEGMAMIVAPQQQHHDAEEESREAAARLEQQRASALEELDREQARIEQAAQEEAHKAAALVEERRAAAVFELEKRRARIEQTAEEAIAVIDMHVQRRDEWLARVEAAEETARAALEQLARMEGEMKRLERLVLASSTNVVPKSRRLAPLAPRPLDGELARASSLDSDADPTPLAMPPSTSTQGRARGKYRIAPMPPPPSEHAESTVASAPNANPSPSGAGAGPVPVGRKRLCVIQ